MNQIRRLLAAFTLLIMTGAAYASPASARWSTPVTISAPHDALSALQLASGRAGEIVSWRYQELIPTRGVFGPAGASYALAPAGGPFGVARPLPRSFASGPMVNLGGDRLAQLILVPSRVNTSTLQIRTASLGGRFTAPQTVRGASVFVGRVSVAGNSRGALLVAWIAADAHGEHRVVWASIRGADGRFGPPRALARRSQAEQVNVAVGAHGTMVVAFPDKHGRMLARVRRHGQHWGPIQDLGPVAVGTENDVTPFVGRHGQVLVAWYETQLCEGGCEAPGFTRIAVQAPTASHFSHAQLIERDPTGLQGAPAGVSLAPVVLAVGGNPPMVIFLARPENASPVSPLTLGIVKVTYSNGHAFGAPQAISPADQQVSDIAAAAAPTQAIVTWVRADPPGYYGGTVFAAVSPGRAAGFGAPEQVSPSEQALDAVVVFNPPSSSPGSTVVPWTVAWTGRPAGDARTVVRVSTG